MAKRILVVDDDPDTVLYLSSYLEDEGYEVATAEDATAAITELGSFEPDAILVDVMMPGRSGLDLLVQLRRDARWQQIPVLVITGDDNLLEEKFRSYLGSHEGVRGPDGVLGKPVDLVALLATVERLTGTS